MNQLWERRANDQIDIFSLWKECSAMIKRKNDEVSRVLNDSCCWSSGKSEKNKRVNFNEPKKIIVLKSRK